MSLYGTSELRASQSASIYCALHLAWHWYLQSQIKKPLRMQHFPLHFSPRGRRSANVHQPPRHAFLTELVWASFALREGCFCSSSWLWGLPLIWYRGFDMYYRNDPSEYSLNVRCRTRALYTLLCDTLLVGLLLECTNILHVRCVGHVVISVVQVPMISTTFTRYISYR